MTADSMKSLPRRTRRILAIVAVLVCVIGAPFLAIRLLLLQIIEKQATSPRPAMAALEIAISSYKTEYLRLLPGIAVSDAIPVESRGRLLEILIGDDIQLNPRTIRFYEPPPLRANRAGAGKNALGEWELRDRWGTLFRVHLDVNGDGMIPNPAKDNSDREPDVLKAEVILYSAGPDCDFATWKDNIKSWQ